MADLSTLTATEIIDILAKETARHRQTKKVTQGIMLGCMGAIAFLYLLLWIVKKSAPDFTTFAGLTGLIGSGAALSGTHKAALKEAAKLGSRQAAGPLVEAYVESQERSVIEVCREALPQALAAVESAEDFDPYQRGQLSKLLNVRYPIAVVSAAVECMGRVSGKEVIPTLERFQAEAVKDKRPDWQRLGQRALQILPDVRMRVAREIIDRKMSEAEKLRAERMDAIEPEDHVNA